MHIGMSRSVFRERANVLGARFWALRPLTGAPDPSIYTERRPWRSRVACVFDADCGEDPELVDEKPPGWSSAECELMPH